MESHAQIDLETGPVWIDSTGHGKTLLSFANSFCEIQCTVTRSCWFCSIEHILEISCYQVGLSLYVNDYGFMVYKSLITLHWYVSWLECVKFTIFKNKFCAIMYISELSSKSVIIYAYLCGVLW